MKQSVYDYSYELKQRRDTMVTRIVLITLCSLIFISLFFNYILCPVIVKSNSMTSDIANPSGIFVTSIYNHPKRGDVVLLKASEEKDLNFFQSILNHFVKFFTFQQYSPYNHNKKISETQSVRRLLALPGDTIYIKDYVLYIKPQGQDFFLTEFELSSKPYNIHIFSVPASWDNLGPYANMQEITLAEDEYFFLADNRIESIDSRLYGTKSKDFIRGKVVLEYFPFDKFRIF